MEADPLDTPPIIIAQSRLKLALAALGGLAFVVLGVWLIKAQHGTIRYPLGYVHFWGWVCAVFFGLCSIGGAFQVVRPTALTIDREGFRWRGLFVSVRTAWSDVDSFTLRQVKSTKYITWTASSRAPVPGRGLALIRFLTGGAVGFPAMLAMKPDDLLALLNRAKARWGTR